MLLGRWSAASSQWDVWQAAIKAGTSLIPLINRTSHNWTVLLSQVTSTFRPPTLFYRFFVSWTSDTWAHSFCSQSSAVGCFFKAINKSEHGKGRTDHLATPELISGSIHEGELSSRAWQTDRRTMTELFTKLESNNPDEVQSARQKFHDLFCTGKFFVLFVKCVVCSWLLEYGNDKRQGCVALQRTLIFFSKSSRISTERLP